MTIKLVNSKAASQQLLEAFKTEDVEVQNQAFESFAQAVANDVAAEYLEAQSDSDNRTLQERGFRTLTSKETEYYQAVIGALESNDPKQAFADLTTVPEKMMPTTIIDDVMKNITEGHALLAKVKPRYVGYITRWIKNKHTRQTAAWGKITDAIVKEVTSAFETVDVKQGKLSAFACISLDMLKLGPVFIDGYVRTVLGESIACGLEYGIVDGKGIKDEPIGLNKDIHEGVSVDTATGYPKKAAVKVMSFDPATYGELVNKLAKDEKGNLKPLDLVNGNSLTLIVNNTTWLTKVMPAIRVCGTDGVYRDRFPVATDQCISNFLEDGVGILALLDEYNLLVAGERGIESSDEFKFLNDERYFKIVNYAYGQADDNTTAILLDLSALEPAVVPVAVKGTVATKPAV
ncbi:MAG: phage major capsid protein [Raoultibacter sp.]